MTVMKEEHSAGKETGNEGLRGIRGTRGMRGPRGKRGARENTDDEMRRGRASSFRVNEGLRVF